MELRRSCRGTEIGMDLVAAGHGSGIFPELPPKLFPETYCTVIARVFQGYLKTISRVAPGNLKGLARLSEGYFKGISRVVIVEMVYLETSSRVFQEYFKGFF